MCLLTPHQYHTVALLHNVTQISLRDSHTIIVTFEHHNVLIGVVLDAIIEPQDRPVSNHFFFLFIIEIRLPLRTASCFDDAPHAFNDFNNGVSVPSFFLVGPGILPIRWRKAARLPELPVRSGGLLITTPSSISFSLASLQSFLHL